MPQQNSEEQQREAQISWGPPAAKALSTETEAWGDWRALMAAATRQSHQRLDRHEILKHLASQDCTNTQYLSALDLFARIWPSYAQRQRWARPLSEALLRDFDHFSQQPPLPATLPEFTGRALDGWQYVMWGSTQGAKYILARLQQSLPSLPHHFFTSLARVNEVPFEPQHTADQCADHANRCFQFWEEQAGHILATKEQSRPCKALIVEDDADSRLLLKLALEKSVELENCSFCASIAEVHKKETELSSFDLILVDGMLPDGKIELQSEPGKGTKVSVTLPKVERTMALFQGKQLA